MQEFIQKIFYSPFELIFNTILIIQWALFMWGTLTPKLSKKQTLLIYIPLCFVVSAISLQMPARTLPRLLFIPTIMIVSGFLFYRNKPLKTIFCSFFPAVAIILGEAVNMMVFPEVYLNFDSTATYWLNARSFLLLFFYIPTCGLVLWFTASQITKSRYSLTAKQWAIFLFFPLSQVITVYYIFNSFFDTYGVDPPRRQLLLLGAFIMLCIAADIALIRTITDAGRKAELEATNRMLEKQLNMQLSHYKALTSQYEANRRIRHDIMHHVNTIQYLLADGKQQEAAEYAGQFLQENRSSSMLGQCDNPVVDAFLYGRVQEAENQGISVETDIILPVELPVSNTDLVIVFGNIMDNAVEACARVVHPSIRLDARIEGSYLIITEENPALPEAEDNKKRRIPELERGVGMHILESVAQKHNGSCLIETKDGKFTVSVILRLYRSKI